MTATINKVILKKGREKSLLRRHPWVFSGAVESVENQPGSGETVAIHDSNGQFIAWGAYSPTSQIRARVWSWNQAEDIDSAFLRERILQSVQRRMPWIDSASTNAYRLVHAESDNLPGLIVDRYGRRTLARCDREHPARLLSTGCHF